MDMFHQYTIEAIRREIHTERICENGSLLPPRVAVRIEDYLVNDPSLMVAYAEEAEGLDAREHRIIEASVLTERILSYDKETVLTETFDLAQEEHSAYRPFYASFMIKADREIQEKLRGLDYAWYGAYFYPKEKEEAYRDIFSKEKVIVSDAVFLFSVTPGFSVEGRLVILPEAKDVVFGGVHLNRDYSVRYDMSRFAETEDTRISETLQGLWKKDALKTVEVYNIGQGNADYLRSTKSRMLFDLGYPYRSIPGENPIAYRRAILAIRQAKPSAVILSDWDWDHFTGWVYANADILNVTWIAPALSWKEYQKKNRSATSISTNAYRLAAYLQKKQLLLLAAWQTYPRTVTELHCQGGQTIRLEMGGSGSGDQEIALRSRHGLYFTIAGESSSVNTVLAADVPYSSMREGTVSKELQILHVPHHCAKMQLDVLEMPVSSGVRAAIISADRGTEYDLHRIRLEKNFGAAHTVFTSDRNEDNETLAVELQFNAKGPARIGKR